MRNELLGQLTTQDIKEIYESVLLVAFQALSDLDYRTRFKTTDEFDEYNQSDEFYKDVLNHMKDTNHYKPSCKERYPVLLEQAEFVTNHTLEPGSRKAEDIFLKKIVARQLFDEGYSYSEIGRTIGMSHATVMYYVSMMNDMLSLPKMYITEVTQYEKFKEIADTI